MKMNIYFKRLVVSLLLIAGMFTSCEDQPDKFELTGGLPQVSYIRMPYLAQSDSLIVEASLKSIICLVGDNLTSIKELYFNDQKAQLNTSYITSHTMIVQIPDNIPEEVSDKIYMVTAAQDTVEYGFHVIVPKPMIASMSCEYATAGSEVTLYGNYFIDDPNVPLTVTLPDGKQLTTFTKLTNSTITFRMPECDTEGSIRVASIYGESTSTFHYLDSRGLMFDFDGKTGLSNHGWHEREIKTDETSLTGNFVQLGDGTSKMSVDGAWNDGVFAFEYWCGSWDDPQNVTSGDGIALHNLVDFTDFANMALKFEMYIPTSNPWSAGAMQICFAGYDKVTLSGNPIEGFDGVVAGANAKVFNGEDGLGTYGRALYRPWMDTGSYDTGDKWVTVTVPISNFTLDRLGAAAESVPSSPGDFASLTFFVVGGGVNGTECTPIIKLDNIRAVPNK